MNESWTAEPGELELVEHNCDSSVNNWEVKSKYRFAKNGFLLGEVILSEYLYQNYRDGSCKISEKDFVNPHPWKGREEMFIHGRDTRPATSALRILAPL